MDEILLTEIDAGVATVTLNRPKQMNALSAELRRRFGQALEGRLSQAATARLNRERFAAMREAVMSRGKDQSS
jgi:hypothetical protein